MTLSELIEGIDDLGEELTIYAQEPWSEGSLAVAVAEPEDGSLPVEAAGMRYLLEVPLAKDVLEVWREWRGGAVPSLHDSCEAVIHYAENDAYLPTDSIG